MNGLSWTPKLIGRHIGPHTIRARIAECGAGALVNAWDVPACFKRILLHPEIAHMFVYRVLSVQYGEEYFADRTNPFGYIYTIRVGMAVCTGRVDVEVPS